MVQSAFNDPLEQLNGGFPYCLCIALYLVCPFVDRGEKDRRCRLMKLKNWNTSPVLFFPSSDQVATRKESHFIQFL